MSSTEKQTRCVPDLVGLSGLGLDRGRMDVLEEFEATGPVWCLQHGDLRVVAVEADGSLHPRPTDGVATEHRQPEVGEESDSGLEIADGNRHVLKLDWRALTLCSRSVPTAEAAEPRPAPRHTRKDRTHASEPSVHVGNMPAVRSPTPVLRMPADS